MNKVQYWIIVFLSLVITIMACTLAREWTETKAVMVKQTEIAAWTGVACKTDLYENENRTIEQRVADFNECMEPYT